jgi:mannitol/fructose-specific phosphotransferase system IIA component (Ntr-type)
VKVSKLVREDLVLIDLENKERDEVLSEMVGFLKKGGMITKDKELYERLRQREELGSTAIGDGVAIPHCKLKSVGDPLLLVAVSRSGVDFRAADGSLSHLFFLVVTSPENPSLNLQILAAVAHLVRKAETLFKRALQAAEPGSIIETIREEEQMLHE